MESIAHLLPYYGLQHYEARLHTLGIHSIGDLYFITEYDLLRIGMTLVEARMLLSALSGGWNDWSAASATSVDDTRMMSDVSTRAAEKEREALEALQSCYQLACSSGAKSSMQSISHAMQRLGEAQDLTRNAFLAFTATSRGRASCRDGALRKAFDRALKAVRDMLVWRVQMSVPWGNREAFLAELERAHGGPVNQEMLAQFLHSHSKTICEEFPSAFLSNCKIRRRAPRPPKATTRAENSRGESSADADIEASPEEVWQEFEPESIGESSDHQAGLEICQVAPEAEFKQANKVASVEEEEDDDEEALTMEIARATSDFLGELRDNTIEKVGSEKGGSQRLSFMHEHNNFMNMRIQALVCDLRNDLFLQDVTSASRVDDTINARKSCRRPRKNSILPDDHEQKTKMSTLENCNAEPQRRSEELVTQEFSRSGKPMSELRAELDTADKDNASLRRDLKKCQHVIDSQRAVIERLVKELEMATRTVAPPAPVALASQPTPPSAKEAPMPPSNSGMQVFEPRRCEDGTQAPQRYPPSNVPTSVDAETSTIVEQAAKTPPRGADLEKTTCNEPGFISDLSNAIGYFFDQLGVVNTPANASAADDFDEPFVWAGEPHGHNVNVDDDGQTATFIGVEKTALHAYVVTAAPPLLENDQGYGFEVLIKKVRTGLDDGLGIGFTATPPDMWPKELPDTADLIEQSWLVGYNGEMYDGQWHQCPSSPAHLSEGDRVGVQVSQDGQFFVVVNHKVVYSTSIPIVSDGSPLFGVVDLLGNTDAVTLLDASSKPSFHD